MGNVSGGGCSIDGTWGTREYGSSLQVGPEQGCLRPLFAEEIQQAELKQRGTLPNWVAVEQLKLNCTIPDTLLFTSIHVCIYRIHTHMYMYLYTQTYSSYGQLGSLTATQLRLHYPPAVKHQ